MAPDYNDGKWHGHNGGECPVHPDSIVELVFKNAHGDMQHCPGRRAGAHLGWQGKYPTFAFRVTREYREPRECWITIHDGQQLGCAYDSEEEARSFTDADAKRFPGEKARIVHFREVMEGEAQ